MTFPKELIGKLWHTTSVERYEQILVSGDILPNPPIDDSERWKTNKGSDLFPYVRILGGVSLFDFDNFDEDDYSEKYPICSWSTFVPYTKKWKESVWIEIQQEKIIDNYISGHELLLRWKKDEAYKHTFMPLIEAAHLGPIPTSAFGEILISRSENSKLVEYDVAS